MCSYWFCWCVYLCAVFCGQESLSALVLLVSPPLSRRCLSGLLPVFLQEDKASCCVCMCSVPPTDWNAHSAHSHSSSAGKLLPLRVVTSCFLPPRRCKLNGNMSIVIGGQVLWKPAGFSSFFFPLNNALHCLPLLPVLNTLCPLHCAHLNLIKNKIHI